MNRQKLEIAINQLERVHRDMNECANRFILKDSIEQLQEQVKVFSIHDVRQQRELLIRLLAILVSGSGSAFIDKEQIVGKYLQAK